MEENKKMKTTKTTIFIAMICMLLVSAIALPIGDAQLLSKAKESKPINVDGYVGEISLMTISGVTPKVSSLSNEGKYVGLIGISNYMHDNTISQNDRDYRIDYQNGQLLKRNKPNLYDCNGETKTRVYHGWKWLNGVKTYTGIKRDTARNKCFGKDTWTPINLTTPVQI